MTSRSSRTNGIRLWIALPLIGLLTLGLTVISAATLATLVQLNISQSQLRAAEHEASDMRRVHKALEESFVEQNEIRVEDAERFEKQAYNLAYQDQPLSSDPSLHWTGPIGLYWKWYDPKPSESCPGDRSCVHVLLRTDRLRECPNGVIVTGKSYKGDLVVNSYRGVAGPLPKGSAVEKLVLSAEGDAGESVYMASLICE